jgi:hypothetical protein
MPDSTPSLPQCWINGGSSSSRYYLTTTSPTLNNLLLIKRARYPFELSDVEHPDITKAHRAVESLQNEAASIASIRKNTTIPVPNVIASFSDAGNHYLIIERVQDAIPASKIPKEKLEEVAIEVRVFVEQMQGLKSHRPGGPGGIVFPNRRLWKNHDPRPLAVLEYQVMKEEKLVFVHGDLSSSNVLVDPVTYKVKCVVDWEHAGFYPPEFEGGWWNKDGREGDGREGWNEKGLYSQGNLREMLKGMAKKESIVQAKKVLEVPIKALEARMLNKARRTIPLTP